MSADVSVVGPVKPQLFTGEPSGASSGNAFLKTDRIPCALGPFSKERSPDIEVVPVISNTSFR
jgi:hypothetical protein